MVNIQEQLIIRKKYPYVIFEAVSTYIWNEIGIK